MRAALSDEFADASGKYFDNDSGRFASPHVDALDAGKSSRVVSEIEALLKIESFQMEQLARFLDKLKTIEEPASDGSLLDRTMVLFGSGMGNGNSHVNKDLPVILAGGGFKLGEHKIFPSADRRRVPLCNLYLSMLQRFGVAADSFGTSTGTLTGLEFA